MQPIRPDDQLYLAGSGMVKANPHAVAAVVNRGDGVAKDCLHPAGQRAVNGSAKVGAAHAGEAVAGQAPEDGGREAAALPALRVHIAHLIDLVAAFQNLGQQAHLLGDVVADAPEVNDVAAAAQLRRLLDEQHLVAGFEQPVGEGWTGDAGSINGDFHEVLLLVSGGWPGGQLPKSLPILSNQASPVRRQAFQVILQRQGDGPIHAQLTAGLGQDGFPADKAGGLGRQIVQRSAQRAQRRKVVRQARPVELINLLRADKVLQPAPAQVEQGSVAGGLDYPAAAALNGRSQDGVVLRQGGAHRLRLHFPEAGAAFDVREEEGDGRVGQGDLLAGGEGGHNHLSEREGEGIIVHPPGSLQKPDLSGHRGCHIIHRYDDQRVLPGVERAGDVYQRDEPAAVEN